MKPSALLAAHLAAKRTLLVDEDGVVSAALAGAPGVDHLSAHRRDASELWSLRPKEPYNLAVVSSPRPPRELLRVLVGLDRLVGLGGKILILASASDPKGETRAEATEIFCGAYPAWERGLADGMAVELVKVDVEKLHRDLANEKGMLRPGEVDDALQEARAILTKYENKTITKTLGNSAKWNRNQPQLIIKNDLSVQGSATRGLREQLKIKRVISLSIFGDHRFSTDFWRQMPAFAENYVLAHHALFPGYEFRVHHDEHLFSANGGDVLCAFARKGLVRLAFMGDHAIERGKCLAMLWRLAPAWDEGVEYVFCRDVDALPTWKERCAVEEFIASGLDFHTISDSPSHALVLGGLCGVRAAALRALYPTFKDFIRAANFSTETWSTHGADQNFLNDVVASTSLHVFEHCLFQPQKGGLRLPGSSNWRGKKAERYETSINCVISGFLDFSIETSNHLINHLGASGYDVDRAQKFYRKNSPAAAAATLLTQFPPQTCGTTVLSSDNNDHYSFFLPLTILLWAMRGYRSLVLLVGEPAAWLAHPRRRLEVERAREAGAEIYWIGDFEDSRSSTAAQVARIFGALTPGVTNEEWLLTSDMDMWPLGPWVGGGRDPRKDVALYYANAYAGSDYPHWPFCYVGARARTWREIADQAHAGSVSLVRAAVGEALASAPADADGAWNYDERLLGKMIAGWSGYPDRVQAIDRHFVEGEWRLDRAGWDDGLRKLQGTLAGVADAHLLRPGYTDENWRRLRPVLELALPPDLLKWAEDYRAEWIAKE